MDNESQQQANKQVAIWLLIGVAMIVVQILLGGITRLTESGLSITEWKPIAGTLPPLNETAWIKAFEKYKLTDQYKFVHQHFSLADFKLIFFWEWFHRVWARLMGLVFLTGFIYFLVKKKFNKKMIRPMVILFLLGAVQGAIGWLMVKSGLVPEKYFVGHVELTTHLIAALVLLCYTLWFSLGLLKQPSQKIASRFLYNFLLLILCVLFLQIMYGGLMAGLRAAVVAPTWPTINGSLIPSSMNDLSPFTKNLISNTITIHFIHRGLAYLLLLLISIWWLKSQQQKENKLFTRLRFAIIFFVFLQVSLGIFTVLNAGYANRLVLFGVLHQFVAICLLVTLISLLFIIKKKQDK